MVKYLAFKLVSSPSSSKFAVHFRRIILLYGVAACKLNVMFFENSDFFTEVLLLRTPKTNLVRELD